MNHQDQINKLKEELNNAQIQRIKAETRLEELTKQEESILREMKELGVQPDQLQVEIDRLQQEIQTELTKAWSLLPQELRK